MRGILLYLTLWIIFGGIPAYSNPICSKPVHENKKTKNLLDAREAELEKFSNKKEIASKADQTLSNLIAAKSKIIGNWMNKRGLGSASEVEIVKQWRRYYSENFILGQYPNKDKKVNQLTEQLIEKLYFKFLSSKEQKRIQAIYESAKSIAIRKIKSFSIMPEQKSQILSRVSAIKLYWMTSFKTSKFKRQPLEVFSWGVAYDPVANEINMALLSSWWVVSAKPL